jgi:hypothetical protein
MQIIFHRHIAEELRKKYTVLDLEEFDIEGQKVEAFCVISAEKINLGEMCSLEENAKKHTEFVSFAKAKDYEACRELVNDLYGKFGGELDSFYDEIISRGNK